jgi:hypothetical protein
MLRLARVATAVMIALLALVASGCGGDDEPSGGTATAAWAADFCSAVTTWTDELQRIGDDLDDPSALDTDSIEQAADDLNAATEEFVDDVRALGPPDTDSGQEVEDSLDTLADTLETERADIEDAVQDVSGLSEIPGAISAIGTSLTAMGNAFSDALEALEDADVDGELERTLEETEECDAISS